MIQSQAFPGKRITEAGKAGGVEEYHPFHYAFHKEKGIPDGVWALHKTLPPSLCSTTHRNYGASWWNLEKDTVMPLSCSAQGLHPRLHKDHGGLAGYMTEVPATFSDFIGKHCTSIGVHLLLPRWATQEGTHYYTWSKELSLYKQYEIQPWPNVSNVG